MATSFNRSLPRLSESNCVAPEASNFDMSALWGGPKSKALTPTRERLKEGAPQLGHRVPTQRADICGQVAVLKHLAEITTLAHGVALREAHDAGCALCNPNVAPLKLRRTVHHPTP